MANHVEHHRHFCPTCEEDVLAERQYIEIPTGTSTSNWALTTITCQEDPQHVIPVPDPAPAPGTD
jgi:hypothetical protein